MDRMVFERLYDRYNRREFVHPDPLEFLYGYPDLRDREIVGLVASGLAYGRVGQIIKSVGKALDRMGRPYEFVRRGSESGACKRLNLYFRWMVRCDRVDPGGWEGVEASKLVVPLDTHMHRISRRMGLTRRNQADRKTALEVTEGFRRLAPEDAVKYDFSLTRMGMRGEEV